MKDLFNRLSLPRAMYVSHLAPFAVWIVIMALPLGSTAVNYAIRAAAAGLALLLCKPWRAYPAPAPRTLPGALLLGLLVLGVWVLPESAWVRNLPALASAYQRFGILHTAPAPGAGTFDPLTAGWTLTLIRLLGSALVIAPIEEWFWRGFVMRALQNPSFWTVAPARVSVMALGLSSVIFGLEHDRWLVGVAAGLCYGQIYRRTGSLWAAVAAHTVTNLGLGIYVLITGHYAFW